MLIRTTSFSILMTQVVAVAAFAAPVTDNQTPGIVVPTIVDNQTTIRIDWFEYCLNVQSCKESILVPNFPTSSLVSGASSETPERVRINSDTVVILHSTNFNFLNYQIRYNIEEEVVEAYQTLEGLWSQIFGLGARFALPGSFGLSGTDQSEYVQAYNDWFDQLGDRRNELEGVLVRNRERIVLHKDQIDAIQEDRENFDGTIREELQGLREIARQAATSLDMLAHFHAADETHQSFMSAIDRFVASANLTINGQKRVIGKKNSGIIITATMTPIRITGAAQDEEQTPVISFEYFVHSKLPLLFHMGYSTSVLSGDDAFREFEQVRALENSDLYAQIRDEDTEGDFAAFLSYEVYTFGAQAKHSILATLGTALSDPGSTFFVGASVKLYDRFLVSVGGNSTQIADGGNMIIEELGDTLQTRELFDTISRRRVWATFVGVSFRVF